MSSTLKLYLLGFIFLIIIIVGVYFAGKNNSEDKPPENNNVPDDNDFGVKLSNLDKYKLTEIVDNLYNDIKGYNLWTHEVSILDELLLLSDTLFVAAVNYWNNKYYSSFKMTLKEALEDETGDGYLSGWDNKRSLILKQMNRLNLQ